MAGKVVEGSNRDKDASHPKYVIGYGRIAKERGQVGREFRQSKGRFAPPAST
jgi:hypothetical protein